MKKIYTLLSETQAQFFTGSLAAALFLVLLSIAQASAQTNTINPLDVSNLSFTPTVIDTSNSPQAVTVSIRATNDITAVSSVSVRFRSATGNQFVTVVMDSENRISGDVRDGVYQKEVIFPTYSKSGNWYVFEINAYDNGSNYRNFYGDDIAARHFPIDLQVISINEDITSPEIAEFSFTPSFIDINNGSQVVNVTLRAKDVQSGVRSLSVSFHRGEDDYLYAVSMNRISGDRKDGIYKGVITFSQYTESGTYNAFVSASDMLGNTKHMTNGDLTNLGLQGELQINAGTTQTSQPTQKSRKRARAF